VKWNFFFLVEVEFFSFRPPSMMLLMGERKRKKTGYFFTSGLLAQNSSTFMAAGDLLAAILVPEGEARGPAPAAAKEEGAVAAIEAIERCSRPFFFVLFSFSLEVSFAVSELMRGENRCVSPLMRLHEIERCRERERRKLLVPTPLARFFRKKSENFIGFFSLLFLPHSQFHSSRSELVTLEIQTERESRAAHASIERLVHREAGALAAAR
jgi:hypothetical protein